MSQPTLHRYILEADATEIGLTAAVRVARLPQGRFPIACGASKNPLTGLDRVEFRLFVEDGAPTTSDDAYPQCT